MCLLPSSSIAVGSGIVAGYSADTPVAGLTVGALTWIATFIISSEVLARILSVFKFGYIFKEWNQKKQLEEYMTEDRVSIKSLSHQMTKEELEQLAKIERNKEIKQLLAILAQRKSYNSF